jgi:hypothetical protein
MVGPKSARYLRHGNPQVRPTQRREYLALQLERRCSILLTAKPAPWLGICPDPRGALDLVPALGGGAHRGEATRVGRVAASG